MNLGNSGITWTLVLMFVVGGLNSLVPVVPPAWSAALQAIIGIVGLFVHQGQIKAGKVGKKA